VLRPPVGAGASFTAVTARRVTDASLAGFVIEDGPGQPLTTGVLAEDATLEVDGVEVSGASHAALDLRAGAKVTVRHSLLRDNEGIGVLIRARAEPRLERNVIIHNGHGSQKRAGVVVEPGAAPVLVENGIGGNGGDAVQGWPADGLTALGQQNLLSPAPGQAAPPLPPAPSPRPRPRPGAGHQ